MDKLALYRGMRAQLRRDDEPYRRAIFQELLAKNWFLRWGYGLCASVGGLGGMTCLVFYSWKYFTARIPEGGELLIFPLYPNEKRSLQETLDDSLEKKIGHTRAYRVGSTRAMGRMAILLYRLSRQHELFLAMRIAEFAAYLHRLQNIEVPPRLVLATSDGNPNGIALLEYARCRGIRAAFLSHGQPNPPITPIRCDLAFLLGESSRERYAQAGAKIGATVLRGHCEEIKPYQPLGRDIRVLIALGKFVNVPLLLSLASWARGTLGASEVAVRAHPTFPLSSGVVTELENARVNCGGAKPLHKELQEFSLALAGDTTSHLEILLAGKPSLYFLEREGIEPDRYGYVREQLVLSWHASLDSAAIHAFFSRPEHARELKRHLSCEQSFTESRVQWNAALRALLRP